MQILKNTVDHLYLFGDKARNRSVSRWTVLKARASEPPEEATEYSPG